MRAQERKKFTNGQAENEKKIAPLEKIKPIEHMVKTVGVYSKAKQIHKGWITKIKFYPDLNYVFSSSLDGFIHIHDIEKLAWKNKTFNLH